MSIGLLGAQLAAVRAALLKLDATSTEANLPMVVGETGWPTAGHADATVSNAATYINNAAQMGIDGLIDMFLFEAFHEPSKTAIPGTLQDNPEEKNFGLLEHSGTPKYDVPSLTSPRSSAPFPSPSASPFPSASPSL